MSLWLQVKTFLRRSSWAPKIRRASSRATTLPSSTICCRPEEASPSPATSGADTRRTSPTCTNSWTTRRGHTKNSSRCCNRFSSLTLLVITTTVINISAGWWYQPVQPAVWEAQGADDGPGWGSSSKPWNYLILKCACEPIWCFYWRHMFFLSCWRRRGAITRRSRRSCAGCRRRTSWPRRRWRRCCRRWRSWPSTTTRRARRWRRGTRPTCSWLRSCSTRRWVDRLKMTLWNKDYISHHPTC